MPPPSRLVLALLAFSVVPFGQTMPPPQLVDYRSDPPRPIWPENSEELNKVLKAASIIATTSALIARAGA